MGWLITFIITDELFMIELFKLFRVGIAWEDNLAGKAICLVGGIWKLDMNVTLGIKKRLEWHETGQA